ncbi:phage baseplate assembly protein V, partial [Geofilum rubicundum]|uniref:phage baseplate assembly protein V n=1 Tax=Geofilum rubicundum TaxID=472113 RepID=UPI001D0ECF63
SVFEGQSNTCGIRLGEMVSTRLPESLQQDVGPDLGRYRVLEITHTVDDKGLYANTFKGVAGATETLPLPENVTPPTAFPELATVIDNADPENLGRVRVRFLWQNSDQNSNWIRVQTPDAGTSGVIEKNRGLFFIPEIDDQVMVAFEQGDPARPYVAGSLFHQGNSGGMAPDNNLKSITTRSGHTIEFDDTDGAEKINIRDNGGSVITFDTKEKSLLIQSVENIDISAKNIRLSAQEKVSIGAQQNVEIAAEADVNTLAKGNVTTQSDGDTTLAAKGALTAEATADATIKGQNVTIEGKVAADLIGMQTSVQGQMTAVQGASGKVEVM